MATARGCPVPDDRLYEIENMLWYRHRDDGLVEVGITAVAVAMARKVIAITPKRSNRPIEAGQAVAVVESIPRSTPIIFAPDRFLGDYVARKTGRELVLWEGSCEIHELFSAQAIADLRQAHPGCITLVHPECPAAVRDLGDVVGSTKALLEAVKNGPPTGTYLVVTEPGIIHQMQKAAPQATFLMAPAEIRGGAKGACTSCNTCPHMRRNTLEKLYWTMRNRSPEIRLDPALIARARLPIDRMLAVG